MHRFQQLNFGNARVVTQGEILAREEGWRPGRGRRPSISNEKRVSSGGPQA